MLVELNNQNFGPEVKNFPGLVLVDFWAAWCGPCKMQGPIVAELAKDLAAESDIKIAKLNVDENQNTATEFEILSIPTLKIFKNGQVVEDMIGLQDKNSLLAKIKKHQA